MVRTEVFLKENETYLLQTCVQVHFSFSCKHHKPLLPTWVQLRGLLKHHAFLVKQVWCFRDFPVCFEDHYPVSDWFDRCLFLCLCCFQTFLFVICLFLIKN